MKITSIKHSRSGFTLVELLIAITIFAIMSTMTILIYFNISETSRRLQISREISETARQITERLTNEIKNQNNDLLFASAINPFDSVGVTQENVVTLKDATGGEKYFVYAKGGATPEALLPCEDGDKNNPNIHCGLYLSDGSTNHYNLVDSFREDESRKRVKISDLQFSLAGSEDSVKKLTIKMTLELTKKSWVPDSLIRASKMQVQTTISSEKF